MGDSNSEPEYDSSVVMLGRALVAAALVILVVVVGVLG